MLKKIIFDPLKKSKYVKIYVKKYQKSGLVNLYPT